VNANLRAAGELIMVEFAAITAQIASASASDDGHHAIFSFEADGQRLNLAIPSDELMQLMSLASQVSGQCQKIRQKDPAMKHVFPTEWWDIGWHPDGHNVILSFRVSGGLEPSFQLHRDAAVRYVETLSSMLGLSMIEKPQTPSH
jgi:hypothetical protein